MLKGDLATTPLPEVLRQLADGAATGCLNILDGAGETAKVYLRGGRVYAVIAPGKRPQLGSRLVSSGALGPEALAEALEAQRTELQGWRLGELLVHLGYVDQPVVESFVNEQVRASLSDLLPWRHATWKFRVNERTREDVAPPVDVETLLAEIESRQDLMAEVERIVHGPDAVPLLSANDTADSETEIDPDAWSLLCKVDGVRTVTELARECGFTLFEAGQVVYTLVQAGLLEVEEPEEVVDAAAFLAEADAVEEIAPAEVASRLAAALGGLGGLGVPTQRDEQARGLELPATDDDVAGSISRVSSALSALLGPATASDDVFGAPTHRPAVAAEPVDPKKAERDRLAAARRAADAEELALAQAELEAAKAAQEAAFTEEHGDDHVAEVVHLHDVRAAAEAQAAADAAEAEAARLEAEAAEAARLEAEAAEAARLEEEARLAEEARLQAEAAEAARLEEEARLVEEARLQAEAAEAARLDAEAAEQARLEEEARLAEQARLEAEAAEAARLEAEAAEAARLEAEAAEQARVEAEAAETARVEAEAAETARVEAEAAEAARLEAEAAEAAHLEAEAAEAARLEAEAAEAARLEAEAAEQARVEAEAAESARLEAEAAETARVEAEAAETARLEAEAAEAARLEAEAAEAARLEAEAAEAARLEAEAAEQARVEAEAAETARLQAEAAEQARLAQQAEDEAANSEFAALTADFDDSPSSNGFDPEAQAAAFAELSASAAVAVAEPTPAAVPAATTFADFDDDPMPVYAAPDTDTAALLRELSSLGLDDDPPPPPSRPAPRTPPRPVAPPAKKKKGLFGR